MSEIAYEAETVINFNEDEPKASIYTASKRVAALLERRGLEPVRVERLGDSGEPCSWWFEIPKWQVLIKPGNKIAKIGGWKPRPSTTNRIDSMLEIDAQNAVLSS